MYLRKGCDLFMDCITISTFRSLEQQAIRQHRELKAKENGYRFVSKETFGQEQVALRRLVNEPTNVPTENKGKLNLYA